MKKFLLLALALVMLASGCVPAAEDSSAQNATEAPQTNEAVTAAPTDAPLPPTDVPTEEPPAEPPYKDARAKYVSIMTSERDKKWEEDVVYYANTYLDPYHGHALVSDRVQSTTIYDSTVLRYASSGSENFFDPELKARFIEKINEIILSIPESTDDEIVLGLWEAAAVIPDLHAYVGLTPKARNECMLLSVAPIETEDGLGCVIDGCEEEYAEQLLGRRLIAVNGFTLPEIKEKLRPLIHYEVEPALDSCITGMLNSMLPASAFMRYIGVMEGDTAVLTVRSITGEETEVELRSYPSLTTAAAQPAVYRSAGEESDMSFRLIQSDWLSTAWYRLLADGEALYFRINKCDADETFGTLLDEAFEQAEAAGKLKKVIVDIRSNPGGYPDLEGNYLRLVNYLNDSGADVYVLINGESYSGAIALPSMLRRRVEKAQLVGTPGGQPVRFFYGPEFYLPNSGIGFKCSTLYADFWPEYGDGPLMPDTVVSESWEDYLEGYDSVLKYILEL